MIKIRIKMEISIIIIFNRMQDINLRIMKYLKIKLILNNSINKICNLD